MRDGVKLFTAVYVPKDSSQLFPFLVFRTPYGVAPNGPDQFPARLGPNEEFDKAGYIFVLQDVRGRYQSEGQFVEVRPHIEHPSPKDTDESTDMYDTVEWLLKNVSRNNGKVGIWGFSYPGFFVSASIVDSHPAIKAASPEAPVTNLFEGDDAYHGGAFMLAAQFEFYSTFFKPPSGGPEVPPRDWQPFEFGTQDGYKYFLEHGPGLQRIAALIKNPYFEEPMIHDTDGDYWRARDISKHMHGIKCAVLTVGGWFDTEDLAGTLRTYHAIEKQNAGAENALVMGPWKHGDWSRLSKSGSASVRYSAAEYYRQQIVFPFFEYYLKGKGNPKIAEANVFDTGSNAWKQYENWPPKSSLQKTIYLHANGKLSFIPPAASEASFDEYVSDPTRPVPYIPYQATDVAAEYMFADQRFASKRKDVLTYVSDPLEQDVTLAGPVSPHLSVSTSGSDSDFVVKLIDIFPGDDQSPAVQERKNLELPVEAKSPGYAELVRGEPFRAKFRESLSNPQSLTPNTVTAVAFDMPDVNHTFKRGHRISVQIQSSWFPLTDLNPQKFMTIPEAKPSDFVKATERVYHTPQAASGIVVQVMPQ